MIIPTLVLVTEVVNIVLLLLLLFIYFGNYRRIKSEFTMGQILFIGAFLVKSVVLLATLRLIFRFLDSVSDTRGAPIFLLLVNAMEMAGLLILLKISWD